MRRDRDDFDDFGDDEFANVADSVEKPKPAAKQFVPRGAKIVAPVSTAPLKAAAASSSSEMQQEPKKELIATVPSTSAFSAAAAAEEKLPSFDSLPAKPLEKEDSRQEKEKAAAAASTVTPAAAKNTPAPKKNAEKKVRDFISQLKSGGATNWLGGGGK